MAFTGLLATPDSLPGQIAPGYFAATVVVVTPAAFGTIAAFGVPVPGLAASGTLAGVLHPTVTAI